MNREDIQKLLGGYATDTLTPEEQQALFEAALNDQELFDAMAREQALRDLLRDPGAKTQLLAAIDDPPLPWYRRLVRAWRPLAAAVAMAGVGAISVVVWQNSRAPKPVMVAQVSQAPAGPQSAAEAAPQPPLQPPEPRQMDAPVKTAAKGTLARSPAGPAEQDRRAKVKQMPEAPKAPDLADALHEPPPLPRAEPKPALPVLTSGLREGAASGRGAVGRYVGAQPGMPVAPVPATPPAITGFRDSAAGVPGGAVGGVAGAAPPSPPAAAPPKTEAQQAGAQSAQSQRTPSQSIQVQSEPAPRFQQTAVQERIQVQASNASVDVLSAQNARALFYGNSGELKDSEAPVGQTEAKTRAASALKKTSPQENEKLQRQDLDMNGIRAGSGGALQRPVAYPGVRYSLRRRTGNGEFQPVDPDNLKAGDTIELEFIPNDSGSLSVMGRAKDGGWREVFSRRVERLKTYTTAPLQSGEKELFVSFTRPQVALNGANLLDQKSRANVTEQITSEPAVYVVGDPLSQQVHFTITLNYK
ncbi:MAG: hypothetical protein LAQ69_24110 [Acidobacteriia bacterium]|nr:hypothetical protein [Terriglobia bacterium]